MSKPFRVMVIGALNAGKSTLVNAILGKNIIPTGIRPTVINMGIVFHVKNGQQPKAVIYFRNLRPGQLCKGVTQKTLSYIEQFKGKEIPPLEVSLSELDRYVDNSSSAELGNVPFERVELFWPLKLLEAGMEIVEVPCLEMLDCRKQEIPYLEDLLRETELVLFTFRASQARTAEEMRYIENILPNYGITGRRLFCVVNGIDQLTEHDCKRCMEYANKLFSPYTNHIYCTSALKGCKGKESSNFALVGKSMVPMVERALEECFNKRQKEREVELESTKREKMQNPFTTENFKMRQLVEMADIDGHIQFIRQIVAKYSFTDSQKKKYQDGIARIQKRQNEKNLNMAVIGEFSTGKSSFINALLRENLLETDAVQGTTTASTRISYHTQKALWLKDKRGQKRQISNLEQRGGLGKVLQEYTSSDRGDNNIACLEVGHPSEFLQRGICIIDTPGTNSLESWHTDVTRDTIREQADACIVLIDAHKPFPQSFSRFVEENLLDVLSSCIFVVTKIDLIRPKEQPRQLAYISRKIESDFSISHPLTLPYSSLFVLNGTGKEYLGQNRESEAKMQEFLQEQRIKIQLQRCFILLEDTMRELQGNMEQIADEQRRKHEQLQSVVTTDLQEFVAQKKLKYRQVFQEQADEYAHLFCNMMEDLIKDEKESIIEKFREPTTEGAIRKFLSSRLHNLLGEAKDRILAEAGMQEGGTPVFFQGISGIGESICNKFEKKFKKEYRQLALLAHDIVNDIEFTFVLDSGQMINVQADLSIKRQVSENLQQEDKSFWGKVGAGAAAGAVGGSVIPGIGTLAGAVFGGIAGLVIGGATTGDASRATEFRQQVSGQVHTLVNQYFSSLSDSMMQAYNQCAASCLGQVEKVMDNYLKSYTEAVDRMRSRERQEQQEAERALQKIQNDLQLIRQKMNQIQSAKKQLAADS